MGDYYEQTNRSLRCVIEPQPLQGWPVMPKLRGWVRLNNLSPNAVLGYMSSVVVALTDIVDVEGNVCYRVGERFQVSNELLVLQSCSCKQCDPVVLERGHVLIAKEKDGGGCKLVSDFKPGDKVTIRSGGNLYNWAVGMTAKITFIEERQDTEFPLRLFIPDTGSYLWAKPSFVEKIPVPEKERDAL